MEKCGYEDAGWCGHDIVTVTKDEQKAIKELLALAKKWPETLGLFSFSGSLCVTKKLLDGRLADIQSIQGIFNDGGDPGEDEFEQSPKIDWA